MKAEEVRFITTGWADVPIKEFTWNVMEWDDPVTQTECCAIPDLDCPCGEALQVWSIGSNVNCPGCGRQYRVEISRRLACYTPLDIRFPKKQEAQAEHGTNATLDYGLSTGRE